MSSNNPNSSRGRRGAATAAVLAVLAALLLAACSVDVSGPTPVASLPPATGAAPTAEVRTPPPSEPAGDGSTAGPTLATATPAPTSVALPPTPFKKPVTWADRGLKGKLIFTAGTEGILQFDLGSGEVTSLFAPPDPINSWVVAAAVSPSDQTLVMAYAPPPEAGGIQFGYANLYTIDVSGSRLPQPLLTRVVSKETYFDPTWSPDGSWLYTVHLTAPITAAASSHFAIERMQYPGGTLAPVVADAFWPRVSPDGKRLAFVHYDQLNGANALYTAAANGSQAQLIALPASFQSVDSPMFTPDGQQIVFSGINSGGPASLTWLDRLLGVKLAYADGNPADWFRVPVGGGEPRRLTDVLDTSMYGVFAPDGQHIAYISSSGLFVMNSDGSDIIPLLGVGDLPGSVGAATVNWEP